MNKIKSLLSKRFKFYRYIDPSNYFKHPEYKTPNPKDKLSQLILMRDLRLWVIENIPWSEKVSKYYSDCEHLHKEIRNLEWKSIYLYTFCRIRNTTMLFDAPLKFDEMPQLLQSTRGAGTIHPGDTKHFQRTQDETDLWMRKDYFK